MPFRLTRQFVNLMQPLRESGLIQSVMVHCLRAYRAEPVLLLNTMDVFVKEPLLDWKVRVVPGCCQLLVNSVKKDVFPLCCSEL